MLNNALCLKQQTLMHKVQNENRIKHFSKHTIQTAPQQMSPIWCGGEHKH